MFDLFLKTFLLLSPILLLPFNGLAQRFQWYQFGYFSPSINLLQLQFFQYGTVFLFLVALFNKPARVFQDKYFGILFLFFILGVYFHPKTIVSFHNILLGSLLYYLIVSYTKNVKSVLKVIVVVAFLNTVFSVLQFFDIHWIYKPTDEIIGLMNYKTHLGIYQAIAIPICYALNPWMSIIPITGLLLSKSATAIIPATIGMLYLLKKKLYSMSNLMVAISCLLLFGGKIFHKLSLRFEVWIETIETIKQKFIYGHGIGVFEYTGELTKNYSLEYSNPYSIYLGITHALGIFGLMAFLFFIISKFEIPKNNDLITKTIITSCLILVISGLGYSFMDYPRLAGTVIVLFGFLTIKKGDGELC